MGGGGGAYIRVKNVTERRDKTYVRNKLHVKLTDHYILSYIYNTFIVRHNRRTIYFKNIYKTDLCDCLKRNAKGTHLYSRWVYKRGGERGAYIRVDLNPVGFYGIENSNHNHSTNGCCKIFPKITSLVELFNFTGRTFLSEIFGNARFFLIFAHF